MLTNERRRAIANAAAVRAAADFERNQHLRTPKPIDNLEALTDWKIKYALLDAEANAAGVAFVKVLYQLKEDGE